MERIDDGLRILRAADYRRERWRNGAGWTREVHAQPSAGGEGWDWRLSIAEIDEDAPFSAFAGVDRELVLLEGNGLRLRFDDGETVELQPPHDRLRFAGERALRGELVDGPTRDFNLMWKRESVDARLWHRPLVGSMLLFAEPGSAWAVYVLAGQARVQDGDGWLPAAQGDTILLRGGRIGDGTSRRRLPLDGGGELLVVRMVPAGASAD